MKKEDEEFLERVAKEDAELLETEADGQRFETILKRLIHAPPAPKEKKRRKHGITKHRAGQK